MTPIGLFFALCLISWLVAFKYRRLARATLAFAIFTLWFLATPKTSALLYDLIVKTTGIPTCQSVPNCINDQDDFDAIIVAGWMEPFYQDNPRINAFWSERLWHAAKLHKPGTSIIINSSQYPMPPKPASGQLTYAEIKLMSWGVPRSDIIISKAGRATREAMLNSYSEALARQHKSVLLIAYGYRFPRKYLSLKKIVDDAKYPMTIAALDIAEGPNKAANKRWQNELKQWTPDEHTLSRSRFIMHEAAGLIAYRLSDWI